MRHLLSVKSLYRRGVARQASGKHAAAIRDLKRALTLDPNNVPIATKLLEVATQAGQASCAPAPPTPKLTIDHLAYPHIVDAIVSFSDAETRVALLDTCTAIQNRILKLCSHVEITEGSDSQGEYANIVQADGMSFRVYAKWRFQLPTTPSDRWTRICRDRIFLNSRTKDLCGPFTPDVIGYLEVDSGVVRMRPDQLDNHYFHNVCFMRESPTKIVVFPLHDSCAKDWFSISLSDSVTRIVYPLSMYWGPDSVPGVYTVPLVPRNDLYNPIVHRSPQDIPGVNPSLVMVIIWPTVNEVVSEELANPVFEQLLSQTCALIMVAFQSALHSVKVVNVADSMSEAIKNFNASVTRWSTVSARTAGEQMRTGYFLIVSTMNGYDWRISSRSVPGLGALGSGDEEVAGEVTLEDVLGDHEGHSNGGRTRHHLEIPLQLSVGHLVWARTRVVQDPDLAASVNKECRRDAVNTSAAEDVGNDINTRSHVLVDETAREDGSRDPVLDVVLGTWGETVAAAHHAINDHCRQRIDHSERSSELDCTGREGDKALQCHTLVDAASDGGLVLEGATLAQVVEGEDGVADLGRVGVDRCERCEHACSTRRSCVLSPRCRQVGGYAPHDLGQLDDLAAMEEGHEWRGSGRVVLAARVRLHHHEHRVLADRHGLHHLRHALVPEGRVGHKIGREEQWRHRAPSSLREGDPAHRRRPR